MHYFRTPKTFATAFFCVLLAACVRHHEPAPPYQCKPSAVPRYTTDIKPVLALNCVFSCHEPGGSYSSVPLDSLSHVKNACQNRNLLHTIRHDSGFSKMPKDQQKLPEEFILKMSCWAENGFPE